MRRVLKLAENGLGSTSPNPMVGALIERENQVVSEGWHYASGKDHAEVQAIKGVVDPSILTSSTLYVNLEPCAHYGKTPPCTDLIIEKKIPKVVVGTRDPYSKVNGLGVEKLKEAGIQVTEGILEKDCYEINKRFFTFHKKKRPYIILKWAQSQDNFIDKNRLNKGSKEPFWISNIHSRTLSHLWRSQEDAILVGTNTILNDNPKLNVRNWYGKNPIRFVLDSQLKINHLYQVHKEDQPTYVFTQKSTISREEKYIEIDFNESSLANLLGELYKRSIQSLIVEGGKKTIESFIREKLWDEARVFTSTKFLYQGLEAPKLNGEISSTHKIKDDTLLFLKPLKN